MVATEQERNALLRDVTSTRAPIGPYSGWRTPTSDVLVSGIGPAAAAAGTATALALGSYDVVVSLGICGAFRGTADVGDIVVATELIAADLGAGSPTGFLSLSALGWEEDTVPVDPALLAALLAPLPAIPPDVGRFCRHAEPGHADKTAPARGGGAARGGEIVTGPIITVSTVTGTRARADELGARYGAVGEAMEGWGVLVAAARYGVPVLEVRTVSNLIGDRDPATWDFPRAFDSLACVGSALLEQPWH